MRYWFDTEFDEQGPVIHLISIGIVAADGREYYAINHDYDENLANPWLAANVLPQLDKQLARPKPRIRDEVLAFFTPAPTEIWAYFGEYDWIVLRQLVGHMLDWPAGLPLSHMDLEQYRQHLGAPALPQQTTTLHHALEDARWTQTAWLYLENFARE